MNEMHWYCVSPDGMATLCKDEADAKRAAADSLVTWPRRAKQLGDVGELLREIDSLRAQVESLRNHIHTCGPTCSKAACVNRRLMTERKSLAAAVASLVADWDYRCTEGGIYADDAEIIARRIDEIAAAFDDGCNALVTASDPAQRKDDER